MKAFYVVYVKKRGGGISIMMTLNNNCIMSLLKAQNRKNFDMVVNNKNNFKDLTSISTPVVLYTKFALYTPYVKIDSLSSQLNLARLHGIAFIHKPP